jgi:hypothetical protein
MKLYNPFDSENLLIVISAICLVILLGLVPFVMMLIMYTYPTLGFVLSLMTARVIYYVFKGR